MLGWKYLRDTSTLLPAQLIGLVDEHVRRDSNVLSVRATVSKAKDGIALLEAVLAVGAQLLNGARELDTHGRRSLRRKRVETFALEEIHAVEAEGLDLDEGLGAGDLRPGDIIDEHVFDGAFAAFDVW